MSEDLLLESWLLDGAFIVHFVHCICLLASLVSLWISERAIQALAEFPVWRHSDVFPFCFRCATPFGCARLLVSLIHHLHIAASRSAAG